MKYSTDTIGNRTLRDLLSCSAVPHPTAPPRTYVCAYLCVYCNQLHTSIVYLDAVLVVVAYELQKHFSGIEK